MTDEESNIEHSFVSRLIDEVEDYNLLPHKGEEMGGLNEQHIKEHIKELREHIFDKPYSLKKAISNVYLAYGKRGHFYNVGNITYGLSVSLGNEFKKNLNLNLNDIDKAVERYELISEFAKQNDLSKFIISSYKVGEERILYVRLFDDFPLLRNLALGRASFSPPTTKDIDNILDAYIEVNGILRSHS